MRGLGLLVAGNEPQHSIRAREGAADDIGVTVGTVVDLDAPADVRAELGRAAVAALLSTTALQ